MINALNSEEINDKMIHIKYVFIFEYMHLYICAYICIYRIYKLMLQYASFIVCTVMNLQMKQLLKNLGPVM